tara:strand:+ start:236 stop:349 length:114 start_codon:yes stop_codon:yes gene_type:complete
MLNVMSAIADNIDANKRHNPYDMLIISKIFPFKISGI